MRFTKYKEDNNRWIGSSINKEYDFEPKYFVWPENIFTRKVLLEKHKSCYETYENIFTATPLEKQVLFEKTFTPSMEQVIELFNI